MRHLDQSSTPTLKSAPLSLVFACIGISWYFALYTRFLPKECPASIEVGFDDRRSEFIIKKGNRGSAIGWDVWSIAWDRYQSACWVFGCAFSFTLHSRYAMAAVCANQMDYHTAMCHKQNVINVMTAAVVSGRSAEVAVTYDSLVRHASPLFQLVLVVARM